MNLYIILIIVIIIGVGYVVYNTNSNTPNKNNINTKTQQKLPIKKTLLKKRTVTNIPKPITQPSKNITTDNKKEPSLDNFESFNVTNVPIDEFIKTKKKRVRYQFITPTQVKENKDAIKPIVHYDQICTFKSPDDGLYNLRRFFINDKYDFVNITAHKLNKKQYKKYIKETKPQKYKCYSTYELKNINYPSIADIMTSQSNIFEIDNDYSGFAPFHKYSN